MKSIERKVGGKCIGIDASSCDEAEFGPGLDTWLAALASRMAANGFSQYPRPVRRAHSQQSSFNQEIQHD